MSGKTWALIGALSVGFLSVTPFAEASGNGSRLVDAVRNRDAAAVRALLNEHFDVNATAPDGSTGIHWAVELDDLDIAGSLIRAGANVNAANAFGIMPLSLACTNASEPMVAALLKAGADPNAPLPTGETPLMTAVATGNIEAVKTLVNNGAKIDARESSRGQTALMWAAADRKAAIVQILLAHGADIHARSEGGFTALLFSARGGDLTTTKSLLAAGADANETATNGTTPLTAAIAAGHTAVARYLLDQGANVNPKGGASSPLQLAVSVASVERAEKLDFVKVLLTRGADPNARAEKISMGRGLSPLRVVPNDSPPFLIAARNADVELMQLLVAHGADPKGTTSLGVTPLMAAAGFDQYAIGVPQSKALAAVKLCLELGDDVNAASANGETALHGATFRQNEDSVEIVQYLVDHGAKVNVMDARGWTPLTIAEGLGFENRNTANKPSADLLRKLGGIPSPPDYDRNTGLAFEEISFPPGMEPQGSSPNIKPALPGIATWKPPVMPDLSATRVNSFEDE